MTCVAGPRPGRLETPVVVSFCNTTVGGPAVGLLDPAVDSFWWLDDFPRAPGFAGVTAVRATSEALWLLTQDGYGATGLVHMPFDGGRASHRTLPVVGGHDMTRSGDGWLIVSTGEDRLVWVGDEEVSGGGAMLERWRISPAGRDTMHLNSLATLEGELYVSYLGPRHGDDWSSAQAGAIRAVAQAHVAVEGQVHPHSLTAHGDHLWWTESRAGRVWRWRPGAAAEVVATAPGYLRGLAVGASRIVFASSAARRVSRSRGTRNIPPVEGGDDTRSWIYVVDGRGARRAAVDHLALEPYAVLEVDELPPAFVVAARAGRALPVVLDERKPDDRWRSR